MDHYWSCCRNIEAVLTEHCHEKHFSFLHWQILVTNNSIHISETQTHCFCRQLTRSSTANLSNTSINYYSPIYVVLCYVVILRNIIQMLLLCMAYFLVKLTLIFVIRSSSSFRSFCASGSSFGGIALPV